MLRFMHILLTGVFALLSTTSSRTLAAGSTLYVNDDRAVATPVTRTGSCDRPNFNRIQDAVAAAPIGGRVVVCSGAYREQVEVPAKSLTLQGLAGAIIKAPELLAPPAAIVHFTGPQTSRLRGFTITGAGATNETLRSGVRVDGGARVHIALNRIREITGADGEGAGGGTGVVVGGELFGEPGVGWAHLEANVIERYGFAGVEVVGPGSYGMVDDNRITGQGRTSDEFLQVGLVIAQEARADAEDNTITRNVVSSSRGFQAGVFIGFGSGPGVSVRDNLLRENQFGVELFSALGGGPEAGTARLTLRSNDIFSNVRDGIELINTTGALVVENNSNNNGRGILVVEGSVGNEFRANKATGNRTFDAEDRNGGPPANVWLGNTCPKDSPETLCEG